MPPVIGLPSFVAEALGRLSCRRRPPFDVGDVLAAPRYRRRSDQRRCASLHSTLAVGSKDAALIVTLVPGSYSVLVTSADGVPGIALVEV